MTSSLPEYLTPNDMPSADRLRYGALTPAQERVFAKWVNGRDIHDFGAGYLEISKLALKHGARSVVAVDKEPMPVTLPGTMKAFAEASFMSLLGRYFRGESTATQVVTDSIIDVAAQLASSRLASSQPAPEGMTYVASTFDKYRSEEKVDVAIVSWPVNHLETRSLNALVAHLSKAKVVIYRGKNTDATACGDPPLFMYLMTRPLLDYVPSDRNVLAIYGPGRLRGPRMPTGDELAGLLMQTYSLTYSAAEAAAEAFSGLPASFTHAGAVIEYLKAFSFRTELPSIPTWHELRWLMRAIRRAARVRA